MGLLKFQCMTPRRRIRQQKILEIAAEIKESSLVPEFGWEEDRYGCSKCLWRTYLVLGAFIYTLPHLILVVTYEAGVLVTEKLMPKVGRCPAGGPRHSCPQSQVQVPWFPHRSSQTSVASEPLVENQNHRFLSPTPERPIPWVCPSARDPVFLTNIPGGSAAEG